MESSSGDGNYAADIARNAVDGSFVNGLELDSCEPLRADGLEILQGCCGQLPGGAVRPRKDGHSDSWEVGTEGWKEQESDFLHDELESSSCDGLLMKSAPEQPHLDLGE